jgi:hypothetical protein
MRQFSRHQVSLIFYCFSSGCWTHQTIKLETTLPLLHSNQEKKLIVLCMKRTTHFHQQKRQHTLCRKNHQFWILNLDPTFSQRTKTLFKFGYSILLYFWPMRWADFIQYGKLQSMRSFVPHFLGMWWRALRKVNFLVKHQSKKLMACKDFAQIPMCISVFY